MVLTIILIKQYKNWDNAQFIFLNSKSLADHHQIDWGGEITRWNGGANFVENDILLTMVVDTKS